MADPNGESQLETGLLDQSNLKETHKREGLHHSKSMPKSDHLSVEAKIIQSIPQAQSILSKIHPSFIQVAIFLVIYLGVGTVCFYTFRSKIQGNETNGIIDILYFCVVTMTTVGYGDLVPDTVLTKLLACAFVFSGMALICLVLNKGADYLVEKQERFLVKALHLRHRVRQSNPLRDDETSRVKHKCFVVGVILLVLMTVGTLVLIFVEGKDLIDAFYCVCCTITTLGYGDQSFSTEGGRLFAVFWILTSTICLAQFLLYIAELHTESRRKKLVKRVLRRRVTHQDLEAADLNNDGVVEPAEFILFRLKEMGKIRQRDISMVMDEFEELDVDQSGTISVSEFKLAQSDALQC